MSSAFVSLLLLPSAYRYQYRKTNMGNRYQVFVTHKIATWIGKKVTVPTEVARIPFTFFNLSTWVILIKLMQKYFKKIPSHLPIKACCFSQKCLRGTGTYHNHNHSVPWKNPKAENYRYRYLLTSKALVPGYGEPLNHG